MSSTKIKYVFSKHNNTCRTAPDILETFLFALLIQLVVLHLYCLQNFAPCTAPRTRKCSRAAAVIPQRSGSPLALAQLPHLSPLPPRASTFNRSKLGFKLQLGRNGFHIVILQCPQNVHTEFQENRSLEVGYVPL